MGRTVFAALVVAACAFSGCSTLPPADTRITIAADVASDIRVTDARCVKGSGDYFTFQANVVNNCTSQRVVEWKVQWLDADGVAIDSVVSSWNSRAIQPMEICALKSTAPCPEAADFRFYVRKAR